MKTSTTHSYCDDDMPNENDILNIDANKNETHLIDGDNHQCRKRRNPQVVDNEDDCDSLSEHDDDSNGERQIGDGSMENDLFLTTLDATVFASVV